ncbi:1551_t:CDS:1, partial [Diversispora eburnea]
MPNENSINYLISPITTGTTMSLINEQDIATTTPIIHEQEIQIESSTSSNAHVKSKVWDYFTKPFGSPKSRKTKCHECENEFSYHGSTSSLKYHLVHRHKIDISTNLSQVKRQSQQMPSQQPPFLSENENSLLQSGTNSLANKKSKVWEYFTIPYGSSNDKNCKTKCLKCEMEFSYNGSPSLKYHLIHKHNIDISTNSGHAMDQIHKNQNQPLNLQSQNLKQKNADILKAEEG